MINEEQRKKNVIAKFLPLKVHRQTHRVSRVNLKAVPISTGLSEASPAGTLRKTQHPIKTEDCKLKGC